MIHFHSLEEMTEALNDPKRVFDRLVADGEKERTRQATEKAVKLLESQGYEATRQDEAAAIIERGGQKC